jgi:hypothetical protein
MNARLVSIKIFKGNRTCIIQILQEKNGLTKIS